MKAKKARIGDIAEIKTPSGLGYVQYTHDVEDMGQMVRVLPGLYSVRPDLTELAKQKELYFIFYPLNYILRAGDTEIVSHLPIPDWAKPYPLTRRAGLEGPEGKRLNWRIADASVRSTPEELRKMLNVSELTPEQEGLSIYELWPHPAMVKQLARGWTPQRAEELRRQDYAEGIAEEAQELQGSTPSSEPMRHYLYFRQKSNAEKAAQWLRSHGFTVDVRRGADGENWLALAKHAPPADMEEMDILQAELEKLAEKLDGEYDGWELAVDGS